MTTSLDVTLSRTAPQTVRSFYYAGIARGRGQIALLLGPYDTRPEAEANLDRAHLAAMDIDPYCHFDTPLIVMMQADKVPGAGKLNKKIGLHITNT